MRVLLVLPKNNYPSPSPDIDFGQGMPYLAGALKAAGHEVYGINISHRWCHGSAPLALEAALKSAIQKHQPQLIGVGGMAPDYLFLRDSIFFARKISPDIPIVLGGGIVTYDSEYIFSELLPDFAIAGEGEIAIVQLSDWLEGKGELQTISSLIYRKGNKVVSNEIRYFKNLDELPFPDYEPFEFEAYLSLNHHTNNYLTHTRCFPRIMPLSTGRSCQFRCTFCSKSTEYRARSVDHAVKEIAHFYEKYKFNILYINDELFLNKAKRVSEFCQKINALKRDMSADFDWVCYSRVNDVNSELLQEINEAGCQAIGYGFESASNDVLKSMKKGTTVEQISRALQLTKKAGLGMFANFILGDVAETPTTLKETFDFFDRHCRDFAIFFYYVTPYPGSEIFQYCLDRKLITDKRKYYEEVASNKGYVNMTRMSDEAFRKLTEPIMSDIVNGKPASVFSCKRTNTSTCDQGAPFELRRIFYKIMIICPHCTFQNDYVYPLGSRAGILARSFLHFCPSCHKKITIHLKHDDLKTELSEDAYARFYRDIPYVHYYPFDSRKYMMSSVPTPHLLESYGAYNIIRYADHIYGVAQALGPFDLTQITDELLDGHKQSGMFFVGNSVDEVKNVIDSASMAR